MSDRHSATIIAFPRAAAPSPCPDGRLGDALAAIERALAEQRAAVGTWRESLASLRVSMCGLAQSLGGYHTRLGQLTDDLDALNRQARRLESWADGVLDAHRPERPVAQP